MNHIVSFLSTYPHFLFLGFVSFFLSGTQWYYSRKINRDKSKKLLRQYTIVHIISSVLLLIMIYFTLMNCYG